MIERRLCLANDNRQPVPEIVRDVVLKRGVGDRLPTLEGEVRRSIGLARRDAAELDKAAAIWERIGALPNLGRVRAERGAINGDPAETEAGLAILKKVGDVNYLDRFSARV